MYNNLAFSSKKKIIIKVKLSVRKGERINTVNIYYIIYVYKHKLVIQIAYNIEMIKMFLSLRKSFLFIIMNT